LVGEKAEFQVFAATLNPFMSSDWNAAVMALLAEEASDRPSDTFERTV
jgi:hypothetical protein